MESLELYCVSPGVVQASGITGKIREFGSTVDICGLVTVTLSGPAGFCALAERALLVDWLAGNVFLVTSESNNASANSKGDWDFADRGYDAIIPTIVEILVEIYGVD